jgi:3-carboxy-cis,cis-muconate cycloisomerase
LASIIRDLAASTPQMLDAFDDAALVRSALAFEAVLARAQASVGLIDDGVADVIERACNVPIDMEILASEAAHAGTLAIPLVRQLRETVSRTHPAAAALVHLGATSQDVADTALMLQAKAGAALIVSEAEALIAALRHIAQTHAATPMLGRTLLQGAVPVTLGLKAAQWALAVRSALDRFAVECSDGLALQYGGAAGTLSGLDGKGHAVAEAMARRLGLHLPALPWHARRGAIAGMGASLAMLTGAAAKIARDVSLLAQTEVAEAFEPRTEGRGGSSAMAHKRNPTGCQVALSAAIRTPGLAATLLAGLPQEHERGIGGWQAEAPVLAELFQLTHGALTAMTPVVAGLEIDAAAMAGNLNAAKVGHDTGEALAMVARALAVLDGGR